MYEFEFCTEVQKHVEAQQHKISDFTKKFINEETKNVMKFINNQILKSIDSCCSEELSLCIYIRDNFVFVIPKHVRDSDITRKFCTKPRLELEEDPIFNDDFKNIWDVHIPYEYTKNELYLKIFKYLQSCGIENTKIKKDIVNVEGQITYIISFIKFII